MGITKGTANKPKKRANLLEAAKLAAQQKIEEDKKLREEKEKQFLETFPHKYMFTLRDKGLIPTKESGLWEPITSFSYVIKDAGQKAIYIAKEGFWTGDYNYKITNSEKTVIGYIRRHFFNFGFPFVKNRHGCTIKIAETNQKFRLTTHIFFNEREFGGTEGAYKVTCKNKAILAKEFKVTRGRKNIAKIYRVSPDEGFLTNRYIVGYDDMQHEHVAVLISLAIHLITRIS